MIKIKSALLAIGVVFGLSIIALPVGAAVDPYKACDGVTSSTICGTKEDDMVKFVKTIVDTLLYILGAVSMITIVVSGIRYVTSHGDPGAVKSAKDTLFYAVVGLIVAASSYAIVSFVVQRFFPASTETQQNTEQTTSAENQ